MGAASPRLGTIAALILLCSLGAPACAAPFELAREGRTECVVRVGAFNRPSETERFAGAELARYLGRMTGAEFPVREGRRTEVGEKTLFIEMEPQLFPRETERYAIVQRGGTIRLKAGRPRAVLYAVYDFLEKLGCRWLAPEFAFYQGAAEVVTRSPSLSYDGPEVGGEGFDPRLKLRKLYVEEGHSHTAENLRQIVAWMPKVRLNTLVVPTDYQGNGRVKWDNWREALTPELQRRDLIIEVGGHGYQNFLNPGMEDGKLFDQHPEWFGQDASGRRVRARQRVFCTSNAEARRYLIRNFLAYVRERPEIRIYDFWPPDGARWCECEPCRTLGSPSERQALLANEVHQALQAVRPDLRLEVLAYATSVTPPEKTKLHRDILVDFCPIAQSFEVQLEEDRGANRTYRKGLEAWRAAFEGDISLYSYYRKYAWRSLPVQLPYYIERDLHFLEKLPVQGLSTYAEPGDWAAYELNHYVLAHLAWSSTARAGDLVRRFTEARCGPAAPAAREVLDVLGRVLRTHGSLPGTSLKAAEQTAGARKALAEAVAGLRAAADTPMPEEQVRAVRRLFLMADYADRDLRLRQARASNAPVGELRQQVEQLSAFLKEHPDDGVFMVHSRFEVPRLLRSYGLEGR